MNESECFLVDSLGLADSSMTISPPAVADSERQRRQTETETLLFILYIKDIIATFPLGIETSPLNDLATKCNHQVTQEIHQLRKK